MDDIIYKLVECDNLVLFQPCSSWRDGMEVADPVLSNIDDIYKLVGMVS